MNYAFEIYFGDQASHLFEYILIKSDSISSFHAHSSNSCMHARMVSLGEIQNRGGHERT